MDKAFEIKESKKELKLFVKQIRKNSLHYFRTNNIKAAVIGVSGGIDSALTCALLKPVCEKLKIPLVGLYISIKTNKQQEEENAKKVLHYFCTENLHIDLSSMYDRVELMDYPYQNTTSDEKSKIRKGNLKARMRMMYFYNVAAVKNGLVLSTDNLTELYLGFWTRFGDEGDITPIRKLWKSEVYDISRMLVNSDELNNSQKEALQACIDINATDGLGVSNTDLDQIMPDWKKRHKNTESGYREVDKILYEYIFKDNLGYSGHPVIQRYVNTKFKRKGTIEFER